MYDCVHHEVEPFQHHPEPNLKQPSFDRKHSEINVSKIKRKFNEKTGITNLSKNEKHNEMKQPRKPADTTEYNSINLWAFKKGTSIIAKISGWINLQTCKMGGPVH